MLVDKILSGIIGMMPSKPTSTLARNGKQGMASKEWQARNGKQGMASKEWQARNGKQGMASKASDSS
jgi:hypothetical protein